MERIEYKNNEGEVINELYIMTSPLTIGDKLRISVYGDLLVSFMGGDPTKSSYVSLELARRISRALVVTEKGLLPERSFGFLSKDSLSPALIDYLLKLDENLILFINKEYTMKAETPIVKTLEEAKKK